MQKDIQKSKELFRKKYLEIRKQITKSRRDEAKQRVENLLSDILHQKKSVMSYFPLTDEVDISGINEQLAARNALSLPRMENNRIEVYQVRNIETETHRGSYGFFEPIKEKCEKTIAYDIILVPAIAFDKMKNRIGFGHGHYDQFLKGKENIHRIGIAFQEQMIDEVIETDPHDIPMNELCIV